MDDATRKVVDRIAKLMQLAGKNTNEAEAASAVAKAQELLSAYNLTMEVVNSASGESGKRLDEQISGGAYKYQRRLWKALAELNFCMYLTMRTRVREGTRQAKRKREWTHEHRLIGRRVNVIATKNMASYLNGTIERLCRERLGAQEQGHSQFYSSWAVAFREGVADRVIDKIQDRRAALLKKEERAARAAAKKAREQAREGVSVSTALTLASLHEREEQANYDFLHGEGAWVRKKEWEAEDKKYWAEERRRKAEALAAAEREYAQWAAAHPEEAAAEAKKERQRERAKARRRERRYDRGLGYGRYYSESKEDRRRNSGGYYAGWDVGAGVSIDPQVDGGRRRIR